MRVISSFKIMLVAIMATLSFQMQASSFLDDGNEWTLITQDKGVKAYAMIQNCEDGEYYLFKLENTSDVNQTMEVLITVPNEPAYGSQKFVESILAKSETASLCSENDLRLPKMAKDADLSKIIIKLTSK